MARYRGMLRAAAVLVLILPAVQQADAQDMLVIDSGGARWKGDQAGAPPVIVDFGVIDALPADRRPRAAQQQYQRPRRYLTLKIPQPPDTLIALTPPEPAPAVVAEPKPEPTPETPVAPARPEPAPAAVAEPELAPPPDTPVALARPEPVPAAVAEPELAPPPDTPVALARPEPTTAAVAEPELAPPPDGPVALARPEPVPAAVAEPELTPPPEQRRLAAAEAPSRARPPPARARNPEPPAGPPAAAASKPASRPAALPARRLPVGKEEAAPPLQAFLTRAAGADAPAASRPARAKLPPPRPIQPGPAASDAAAPPAPGAAAPGRFRLPPPAPATGRPGTAVLPPPAKPGTAAAETPRRPLVLDAAHRPAPAAPALQSETFRYDAGDTALGPDAQARLRSLASRARGASGLGIEIRAYADPVEDGGEDARREALSRAMEIRRLLIAAGVPDNHILRIRAGAGDVGEEPAARVDVVLVKRS